MRRLPWILCVVLIVALTVMVTNRVVRAQIIFPDQTMQTTAFTEGRSIPTSADFARTRLVLSNSVAGPISNDVVPDDMELVILKLVGWNTPLCTLETRLPSPNQNNGPMSLVVLSRENAGDNTQFEMTFPDGAITIDEGRQPWLNFRSNVDFSAVNSPAGQISTLTVIGYLRLKP